MNLEVTNNYGTTDDVTNNATPSAPPTAAFTPTDNTDGTVDFDATGSDPGGVSVTIADPAGYVWGPAPVAIPNGSNPTSIDFSALAGPPPFNVTLTVTNNFGENDPVTESVAVTAIPTADITSWVDVGAGCQASFTTTNSTSPNSTTISSYNWTVPVGTTNPGGASPTMTFTSAGPHTVSLTVTNNWGDISATDTDSTVTVTCP